MPCLAWQIIRRAVERANVRGTDSRRPIMKLVKESQHTTVEKSATREELKLVSRRIADMDALWRSSAFPQARTEKRAA